jgi:hypothetical protein
VYGFQLAATEASPARQRKAVLGFASRLETIGSSAKYDPIWACHGLAKCLPGVLEYVNSAIGADTGSTVRRLT